VNIATTTAPTAAATASEMSTEVKWLIIGGVLLVIVGLVSRFKLAAAIPFAAVFGFVAYVSFGMSGVDLVTGFFTALTGGVLFLGVFARNRAAAAKAKAAPTPAHA
jgi:uncharacterized membrane protein YphA (DoxX/SURF4 family)